MNKKFLQTSVLALAVGTFGFGFGAVADRCDTYPGGEGKVPCMPNNDCNSFWKEWRMPGGGDCVKGSCNVLGKNCDCTCEPSPFVPETDPNIPEPKWNASVSDWKSPWQYGFQSPNTCDDVKQQCITWCGQNWQAAWVCNTQHGGTDCEKIYQRCLTNARVACGGLSCCNPDGSAPLACGGKKTPTRTPQSKPALKPEPSDAQPKNK